MLVLQNQADAARELELDGVAISRFAIEQETSQFELLVDLKETSEGLVGTLSYASALFDRSSAERLAAQFCRLLSGIVSSPETAVHELPVLQESERPAFVPGSTPTSLPYPPGPPGT